MNVVLARIYGLIIGTIAIIGLFVAGHLFQIMNTDWAMDIFRLAAAAWLLYAGFVARTSRAAGDALATVGVIYVLIGIVGLFNATLGGMLPSGLTGFDVIVHLAGGILAVAVGADAASHAPAHS